MTITGISKSRHISWQDLQERIARGVPFVHRIPSPATGVPPADILVAEGGTELRLYLPCALGATVGVSPLKDVSISASHSPQGNAIEVVTRSRVLFQEIYNFFVSVIDKVHLDGLAPAAAVEETLERWRDLLKSQSIMSEEAQLGLMGELWLLERLVKKFGDIALDAWTGPSRQAHDFRIGNVEFEVKTTRGATHSHFVNGLNQLEPSGGRALYLLSLRLELAGVGSGTTLPEQIASVRTALSESARSKLDRLLRNAYSYDNAHDRIYSTRLQLASPPRIVPVDSNCPKLTRPMLAGIPHLDRIGDVRYRANFEGLGFAEGSAEFNSLLLPTSIGA
jgi:hypothetical protein